MELIDITGLNLKGEGLTSDGRAVARVLPGEKVLIDADGAPKIVTPSTDRVAPPCRYYKSCGGCAMQHASDSFVADWKTDVIRQGLAARGIDAPIRQITTSPAQSRRRAAPHGKRTKKGALVGFHGRASGSVTEISGCVLLQPALMEAMPFLEALTVKLASRKAELSFVITSSEAGVDVDMRGVPTLTAQVVAELGALSQQYGIARLSQDGEPVATHRPPLQQFGLAAVTPPAGAFLQATAHGEAALLGAVQEIIGRAKQVVDLFAGCGTFALPISKQAEVLAVEGEEALIAALDQGWRQTKGLKKVTAISRDLYRQPLLPDELRKADAVVIDPPRAGAQAQIGELANSDVPVIAAISCNPVTFARDAEILINGGYNLDWVQPVDQFRWSTHVELAAKFSKKK